MVNGEGNFGDLLAGPYVFHSILSIGEANCLLKNFPSLYIATVCMVHK